MGLKTVVFDLRQERLVTDTQSFSRARLVTTVRGERLGDLAPLDNLHHAIGCFAQRSRRVKA